MASIWEFTDRLDGYLLKGRKALGKDLWVVNCRLRGTCVLETCFKNTISSAMLSFTEKKSIGSSYPARHTTTGHRCWACGS